MAHYQCQLAAGPIHGSVSLPGSKSITNRALIVAALADGTSVLQDILLAEDTELMIEALRALDISITIDSADHIAEVSGCSGLLRSCEAEIFCGNSGTTLRFCLALAAIGQGQFKLDGIERMRERPIGALVEALCQLGVGMAYDGQEGFPPVVVHSNGLRGGQVSIDSPESSQFISALLLASPYAAQDIMMEVTGLIPSRPYLAMTTNVMNDFGVSVLTHFNDDTREARFIVEAPQRYKSRTYAVEPDASNASYFLAVPAVIGGAMTIQGLGTSSVQGDVRFVDVLEQMGCEVTRQPDSLTVTRRSDSLLTGIDVDLNDMPDTVPTLAVLALFASGQTTIRNVASLRVKETDRLAAVTKELRKIGAQVDEQEDSLRITPPTELCAANIETYNDHRMAMSFALAGLQVPGLTIQNPNCCAKTFPDFFQRFEKITLGSG